jgi:hypothetical protein
MTGRGCGAHPPVQLRQVPFERCSQLLREVDLVGVPASDRIERGPDGRDVRIARQ